MRHALSRSRTLILGLLLATATVAPPPLRGQTPEEEAVAVVVRLFDGMRQRDRAMLESSFHESARLQRAGERDGEPVVSESSVAGWIDAVVAATGPMWDERIYNPQVLISGNLAQVWVEYDLYVGDDFRHCGVDAMHMARTPAGWQIIQLTDTQRREGCPSR